MACDPLPAREAPVFTAPAAAPALGDAGTALTSSVVRIFTNRFFASGSVLYSNSYVLALGDVLYAYYAGGIPAGKHLQLTIGGAQCLDSGIGTVVPVTAYFTIEAQVMRTDAPTGPILQSTAKLSWFTPLSPPGAFVLYQNQIAASGTGVIVVDTDGATGSFSYGEVHKA